MSNEEALKAWLEKFKEPLRICVRLKRLDGSDKQISDYLHPYEGADWEAARGKMDEWLSEEAKAHPSESEQWEMLRKDLAGMPPR